MSGLPYDRTPSPQPEVPAPPADLTEPTGLDMALDDYVPANQPVPEHVQSLMARMSKGKVYLLEESPALVVVDGKERIRGDQRIASLAAQLDLHDPTEWLLAASADSPAPVRPNALFIRSDNIKHLSTSKVFTWSTGLGADVLGIEWLNDETLVLLFRDAPTALLGLSLIAKVGFDPAEGDDPLLERSAHSIPISLLSQAPPDPALSKAGEELLGGAKEEPDADGVRKRGRGTFSSEGRFDLPPLASDTIQDFGLLPGVDPNARIAVRYATEADSKLRREAKQSEWYQRHGRGAGKERASAPRGIGRERERDEDFSWSGRGGGDGRDFAKRIGRERAAPYARPRGDDRRGGGRGGRRTADDLDAELERMAQRRTGGGEDDGGGMDIDMDGAREERRGERRPRGQRRERPGREDLDKELDDMFASRVS